MKKDEAQLIIEHMDTVLAKFAESVAPTIASVKNIEKKIEIVEELNLRVNSIEAAVTDTNVDMQKIQKHLGLPEAA